MRALLNCSSASTFIRVASCGSQILALALLLSTTGVFVVLRCYSPTASAEVSCAKSAPQRAEACPRESSYTLSHVGLSSVETTALALPRQHPPNMRRNFVCTGFGTGWLRGVLHRTPTYICSLC